MLKLKKKQKEAAEAAAKAESEGGGASAPDSCTPSNAAPTLSLLGIGGVNPVKKRSNAKSKKKSAAEIRLQKDIDSLNLEDNPGTDLRWPNSNDLTHFIVSITPTDGFWKKATYEFDVTVPAEYPHNPPKVLCNTRIYHPNINLEGKVCLNILRKDWKPVLDVNAVIYGLTTLFIDPNPSDPLNQDAAKLFREDINSFRLLVERTLRGGRLEGQTFPKLL